MLSGLSQKNTGLTKNTKILIITNKPEETNRQDVLITNVTN